MGLLNRKKYYALYIYLPTFFILCPTVPALLPDNLGEQLIFILEFCCVLLLHRKGLFKLCLTPILVLLLSFFYLALLLSIAQDLLRGVTIFSDYFELVKPIAFLLFYSFYRYSIVDVEVIERKTVRVLIFIFIFLAVWSIIEIIFSDYLLNFSYWLYRRESVPVLRNKAIGSFAQTYQFAYILLLPLNYSLIKLLKKVNVSNLILFILIIVAILLTQSRSMYICVGFSCLLVFFLPLFYRTPITVCKMLLVVSILFGGLVSIFFYYEDELREILAYAFYGFESILEGTNNSVGTRASQLYWAFKNNDLFLIGGGIGKGEMMLESFYSLYYYRYGVIGIMLYLLIPLRTAILAYRIAQKEEYVNVKQSIFYYSLFVFYLITPLAVISSCHQDTPKISFLFYGLIGLVYNKYHSFKVSKL